MGLGVSCRRGVKKQPLIVFTVTTCNNRLEDSKEPIYCLFVIRGRDKDSKYKHRSSTEMLLINMPAQRSI